MSRFVVLLLPIALAAGMQLPRRGVLAATVGLDLQQLAVPPACAAPPMYDPSISVYAILQAQRTTQRLLADEDTFRTMVAIGLPTGSLQMPPQLLFSSFKKLEDTVSDPGAFMDAAIEYVEYTRDANDLVELAALDRKNGDPNDPRTAIAVQDHLDRSMVAARGAAKALDKMVPLLGPVAGPASMK
mmetsp:Transcript_24460/g.78615  ORF Transcript_24460/g.78615 Transcript_24460/m.78615 type:complete len:186 (-) Transcript_24460:105-662(-)